MSTVPASFNLEPDETVLLEMEPANVGKGCFGALLIALVGVFFLLIPTVLAFLYLRRRQRPYRDSKCLVTNRRIIVRNWGELGRLLDLGYDTLTGIYTHTDGWGDRSGKALITLADGSRIELPYLQDAVHFADVAQRAMEAHKARTGI